MLGSAETPTMVQQQADALGLVAEAALNRGIDPGSSGDRYQVERLPDGTLSFHRPDRQLLAAVPPPASVPSDPVKNLRARHGAQGLHIDPRTSMSGWLGERLDVRWAIDVLHPRATGEESASA